MAFPPSRWSSGKTALSNPCVQVRARLSRTQREAVEEAATAAAVASSAAVTARAAAAAKWKRLKRQGLGGKGVEYVRWKRAEAQEMAASREAAIAEAHQMWDRFPVD